MTAAVAEPPTSRSGSLADRAAADPAGSEAAGSGPAGPGRPTGVRRLPVPDCQPPYDDELPQPVQRGQASAVQGTLALSFVLPSGLPAVPSPPPDLRLVPPPARVAEPEDDFGPRPTSRCALPDPGAWAGRLVQAVVEVLAGDRPIGQLVRWTSVEVYEQIAERTASARAQAAAGGRDRRRPVRPRSLLRSVHVSEPADGVAEVAAVVRQGARATAVALRLEGWDGRWQCTALQVG